MNNQGQVIQIGIIIIALFITGFFAIFGSYIVAEFNKDIADDFSTEAKEFITESEYAWTFLDNIYPVLLVFAVIGAIVTYLYIPTHPALIIVEFLMVGFVIVLGGIVSNVSTNIFNSTEFNSTANNFPIIVLVNSNLGLIGAVIALIALLVLFLKRGGERD